MSFLYLRPRLPLYCPFSLSVISPLCVSHYSSLQTISNDFHFTERRQECKYPSVHDPFTYILLVIPHPSYSTVKLTFSHIVSRSEFIRYFIYNHEKGVGNNLQIRISLFPHVYSPRYLQLSFSKWECNRCWTS